MGFVLWHGCSTTCRSIIVVYRHDALLRDYWDLVGSENKASSTPAIVSTVKSAFGQFLKADGVALEADWLDRIS